MIHLKRTSQNSARPVSLDSSIGCRRARPGVVWVWVPCLGCIGFAFGSVSPHAHSRCRRTSRFLSHNQVFDAVGAVMKVSQRETKQRGTHDQSALSPCSWITNTTLVGAIGDTSGITSSLFGISESYIANLPTTRRVLVNSPLGAVLTS